MRNILLSLLLTSSMFLTGCLPLIVGGVATAGYIGSQERDAKTAVSDISLKTHIKDRLTGKYYKYLTQAEISVLEGNVLLTGVVGSPQAATEVEGIVRSIEGVKNIYNELFTDGIYTTAQYSKDSWIATQLKTRLFADDKVSAVNYQINAVNGHVYIFGSAKDLAEVESVKHIARTTKGVVRVYSYISLYQSTTESLLHKVPGYDAPTIESEMYIDNQ